MLIQKSARPDSIVAYFYSTASPRRLLQQNLPQTDSCTAANNTHGLAYSITSSAMVSSPGGKLRPNALAVLRLITNSNLVDCMTGRSAGFSPLRIRPV